MASESKIEWCDSTFNPWIGCTKVSPACDHCYAAVSTPARAIGVEWGAGKPRRRTSEANWKLPLRWNAQGFFQCRNCGLRGDEREWLSAPHPDDGSPVRGCPRCRSVGIDPARRRVFCASLADVFDNEVDPQWRADLFDLILLTPNLDWLLLTKRIGNALPMMLLARQHQARDEHGSLLPVILPNVWIGATISNQQEADRDIPKLLETPAVVRFLSMEPLLGAVNLRILPADPDPWSGGPKWGPDWVIAGGESGHHARPMHPDWARSLRDQCASAGVPFLFKQWGEWRPPLNGEDYNTAMGRAQRVPCFIVSPAGTVHCFENEPWTTGGEVMRRVGKKAAGRLLDGVEHNGYPVQLEVLNG